MRSSAKLRKRNLRVESLENRRVLATLLSLPPAAPATVSPWHNEIAPTDVNRDGDITIRDAASVLSGLTAHGSMDLAQWPTGEGETQAQREGPAADLDVDGDRTLTPNDAREILASLYRDGDQTGIVYDHPEPSSAPRMVSLDEFIELDLREWLPADMHSEPNGDVHVGEIGDDATPLPMDDWEFSASILASIDPSDDVDVFQFTAADSTDYALTASAVQLRASVQVEVLSADGDVIARGASGDWLPFHTELPGLVTGETYFVRVSGDGEGINDYFVSLVRPWDGSPGGELGEDEHGSEFDSATDIFFDEGGIAEHIHSGVEQDGDVDMFRANVNRDGVLVVTHLHPEQAIAIEVFNADGEVVPPLTDGLFAGADMILEYPTQPGEYYVRVAGEPGYVGEYSLEMVIFPEDPFNLADSQRGEDPHADTLTDDATPIGVGEYRVSHIDQAGDADVFQLRDFDSEVEVRATGVDGAPVELRAYALDGELVRTASDSEVVSLEPGDGVYLEVVGAAEDAVGRYELSVQLPAPWPVEPDSELGNDIHADEIGDDATIVELEDAFPGSSLGQIISNIDTDTDVDAFRVVLPADAEVTVSAWSAFPLQIQVFDLDGELIGEQTTENSHLRFGDFAAPAFIAPLSIGRGPGEAFVTIEALEGDTGRYDMWASGFDAWRMLTGDSDPDAPLGEDVHGDTVADRTVAEQPWWNEYHSNIDTAGDADVFGLLAEFEDGTDRSDDFAAPVDILLRGRDIDLQIEVQNAAGETLLNETVEANTTWQHFVEMEQPEDLSIFVSAANGKDTGEYFLMFGGPFVWIC